MLQIGLWKKDNAIVCRYASKYNLLILLLVCWRPKIESADRPLNTGSTSNQQDFPDKRRIKSFIPSAFVRASMVQMSPSCELTYYVSVLCSFDSVGIPLVLSLRPLLYCLPPPRRRRGLRLNNATWIPYYVHLPEMVWAVTRPFLVTAQPRELDNQREFRTSTRWERVGPQPIRGAHPFTKEDVENPQGRSDGNVFCLQNTILSSPNPWILQKTGKKNQEAKGWHRKTKMSTESQPHCWRSLSSHQVSQKRALNF